MRGLLLFVLLVTLTSPLRAALPASDLPGGDEPWFSAPGEPPAVELYFFWSQGCPHCLQARPFVQALAEEHPWIRLHSLEVMASAENRERFRELAALVGFTPRSVPTFVWCGRHFSGFDSARSSGEFLLTGLSECHERRYGTSAAPATTDQESTGGGPDAWVIPGLDRLNRGDYSLPMLAVILGGLDAFNPCAFFVLLFLLSLLVHTHSRGRMLLVGGLFVAVSGLIYFAFMAAWLNLFQLLGGVRVITLAAGVVAAAMGLVNIGEYFRARQAVSLGLSAGQRQRLFGRMRGLLDSDRLSTLLIGTLTLAVAANSYELLCTLGLPMVFTRILSLESLSNLQYYAYLALYNLVYVLPLAAIVLLFVATMGRRTLSEAEGRFLKLLSGLMMTGLGLVLVLSPQGLSDPLLAAGLIVTALVVSLLVHVWHRRRVFH